MASSAQPACIALETFPSAVLLARDGVVVEVNRAYTELLGWAAADVVGQPVKQLIEKMISPVDRLIPHRAAAERAQHRAAAVQPAGRNSGQVWCRVIDPKGKPHAVRIDWRTGDDPRESFVFFTDAEPEAFGQRVTQELARSASGLSQCRNELEVLERATETLAAQGLIATVLIIDAQKPYLRYGPTRAPAGLSSSDRSWEQAQVPVAALEQINPHFAHRSAAFIIDGVRIIRETYTEPVAAELIARLPASRMVQAPLFAGDQPYGAVVVTGDTLTPLVATAIELFAELVGNALFNMRLRRERVERERLAALGEAAAVMAHEVRNPVGAILNALALSRRRARGDQVPDELLRIISEEAARLEQLVSLLLEFGRPLTPRLRAYSLSELSRKAVALLVSRRECEPDRVRLPAESGPDALLDPDLALLALTNVLKNAVQSTPAPKAITITLEQAGQQRAVVIEDAGPGITPDVATRIGEPFTTTRATGTGMGLAVVRRVLDACQGRVEIGASALGGARVALWFPAVG
ncbi:MAG: PAS domain-containing protein [Archangiaceae bacterium]|nr:PAS domain-containing protein [Archangiaceae bacterium]